MRQYVPFAVGLRRLKITVDQMRYAIIKKRIKSKKEGGRVLVDTTTYQAAIAPPTGYITVKEYAEISGFTAEIIYKRCEDGKLPHTKDGRHVYIRYGEDD